MRRIKAVAIAIGLLGGQALAAESIGLELVSLADASRPIDDAALDVGLGAKGGIWSRSSWPSP
jgi:hypothetical protein